MILLLLGMAPGLMVLGLVSAYKIPVPTLGVKWKAGERR
jgi:hypothetical protein